MLLARWLAIAGEAVRISGKQVCFMANKELKYIQEGNGGQGKKSYAKNDWICQCALAIRLGLLWQGVEYDTSCLEIFISKEKSYNVY